MGRKRAGVASLVEARSSAMLRDEPAPAWAQWLLQASPVGIASLDLAGRLLGCNEALARLAGQSDPRVLHGRTFAELFARRDRDDLTRQFSKLVMGTAHGIRLEGLVLADGGETAPPLVVIAFPLVDGGEVVQLGAYLVEDVERAAAGEALAQQQKMQAVGQLAGGIAHDFNNLLTAMLGFCDLLLGRHPPGDASHEEIVQVRDNAQRAAGLVRQLLAFSRKQTLRPVRINVARALTAVCGMLPRLLGPTIEVRLEAAPSLGDVDVDPVQFDQIVLNLAVNARDAMPGGGTLTLRSYETRLGAAADCAGEPMPAGPYVCIEVADTGVGIPTEIIGHIFEPFFTTKDVGAGTGLGLATVYGIVRQTGGFIAVDSALGEGTTFKVMLPMAIADSATAAAGGNPAGFQPEPECSLRAPERPAATAPQRATVLVVDDEDPIRVFAARALRKAGYRVLEAVSGEQALDVIATHGDTPIDILLTDVIMPGMDGHTLAQLARRERAMLRVIAMSGFQEDVLLAGRNDDGESAFLAKPFTLAELTGKVHEVLNETACV